MASINCFHCGDNCISTRISFDGKSFCCKGCKTVYELLHDNDLHDYYTIEPSPGHAPQEFDSRYSYLDNEDIASSLYDYKDDTLAIVNLFIPKVHCSSCIWILENLPELNNSISATQVNFPEKNVRISYKHSKISLRQVVELLSSIGYAPTINLSDVSKEAPKINRSLLYKLGVAGFGFGNIMLLSFPEYFQTDGYWIEQYKPLFRGLIFATILPVVFYAANDYFISAFKGLRHRLINIDVPIALGISVLFARSTFEIAFGLGQGYFDSLAGFVFFLLLGRIFQKQTYDFLSFERDFKSYFPIAVTKINHDKTESNCSIYDVHQGDRLLVRNQEIIPVDGILINSETQIDYSFVTGESLPIKKMPGAKLFAGGKLVSSAIELEVLTTISQSYLTKLWSNDIFNLNKSSRIKNVTDAISRQFTLAVLFIALFTGVYWYFTDVTLVANTVTAVLIVACPCALALSAPFALGNMLRIFGKEKMYLKNTNVIERIAAIDHVFFDKTGTLTTKETQLHYEGVALSAEEFIAIKSLLRLSNHPLSRSIYSKLRATEVVEVKHFKEELGKGLTGEVLNRYVQIGSSKLVGSTLRDTLATSVYVSIDHSIKGRYVFNNKFRPYLADLFSKLNHHSIKIGVLSGDNDAEKTRLVSILPAKATLLFDQKPIDKLNQIKNRQLSGEKVMMVGDGLNDAGALAQSDVGLSIAEDINVFTPASDGIIDASSFNQLPRLLRLSRKTMKIIKLSFIISLMYNVVGMFYAISGQLTPIVAAILMPLSSITIVGFVTFATNFIARKRIET